MSMKFQVLPLRKVYNDLSTEAILKGKHNVIKSNFLTVGYKTFTTHFSTSDNISMDFTNLNNQIKTTLFLKLNLR